ncbi:MULTISPECIES: hypothetical protein [unclassified Streptomyces]|uniref:hypothetical protein n=1 Tax=unclassified Streptomyces TaxID=2593676 RepID=UPI00061EA27F|nr:MULTISPECIES: hypothetical protein [unclassified Streptomyces]APU41222.1 hypothetical protein BSL84_17130 [Streptomyces sp. TN58]KJK52471.1 hypothetical protein UK14_09035 [Streptomyces sp. NRRL F-4428]
MPWIKDYVRSDGTPVKGYFRLPAGARRETTLLGLFVAGAFVLGNGGTTAGAGPGTGTGTGEELPRPRSTVVYPIKWPAWEKQAQPHPTPAVSYPIVFPSPGSGR